MQTLKLTGIIADQPSANGYIYPTDVLAKAIAGAQHSINNRSFLGTIGSDEVTIMNTTHLVTELKLENNHVISTIEILPTEYGEHLSEMLTRYTPQSNIYSVVKIEGNLVTEMQISQINVVLKPSGRFV